MTSSRPLSSTRTAPASEAATRPPRPYEPTVPSSEGAARDELPFGRLLRPPFLPLRAGSRRAAIGPDLLAGLALLVVAIPEQLATARLAGMPTITGLYAFIVATALFALLGSNPQLSIGADSTIAPLFAVGLSRLAPLSSARYVELASILAIVVGVLVALVGLARLGWIAEFLSAPIITGFLAGVAVIITVHQLPDLLGLSPATGSTLRRLAHVADNLGHTSVPTLLIGAAVLAVVLATEKIDRRVPGAFIGLVLSTLAVVAFSLRSHGVAVLGNVAHAALHLGVTGLTWSTVQSLLPTAGVVALVVVSQSAATTRAFADQGRYEVDVARDFVAIGAGSIAAGLVGSFAVDASPARTAIVASAGGRSQLGALAAAGATLLLLPAMPLLAELPLATLAAVLIYVATRLFHLGDLVSIARFDRFEFGLALICLLTVALAGVEQGIAVAVGLALLDRTRLSARPHLHALGRLPDTTSWVPLNSNAAARAEEGVLVLLFATPLWYANAQNFHTQVKEALRHEPLHPRLLVLEAVGMGDLDFTGARALGAVLDELATANIEFAIARPGNRTHLALERSGLLGRIGADHVFASVDAAVRALGESRDDGAAPAASS